MAFPLKYILVFGALISISFFWFNTISDDKFSSLDKPSGTHTNEEKTNENMLIIPEISVSAPLIENPDLGNGILFLQNENFNETKSAILVGHSSGLSGEYKDVFKNLDTLEVKDKIKLFFSGKKYEFEVSSKSKIKRKKYMPLPTQGKIILVTCWPVGTTLKQLVVEADFLDEK